MSKLLKDILKEGTQCDIPKMPKGHEERFLQIRLPKE